MNTLNPDEIPIFVVSCDKYGDLWNTFFHLFFKYWPECPFPVYLVSNTRVFHDSRVKSILVGPDEAYSTNLIKALRQISAEKIIFWIDDRPPCKPVDTDQLLDLFRLAQERHASYLQLLDFHPYALVPAHEKIGEISKSARYFVSMTIALWNRETLLSFLVPGVTAWEIEKGYQHRNRIDSSDKFYSLSIELRGRAPIQDIHLVFKGRIQRKTLRYLTREHLETQLQSRPKVSLLYSLYIRINHLCWDIYYYLKWAILRTGHHRSSPALN